MTDKEWKETIKEESNWQVLHDLVFSDAICITKICGRQFFVNYAEDWMLITKQSD